MTGVRTSSVWPRLEALARGVDLARMRAWLEREGRFERLGLRVAGVHVDFSRQAIDEDVVGALLSLAAEREVGPSLERMFQGERVNVTEHRAALHVALRAEAGDGFAVDGVPVVDEVLEERARMLALVDDVWGGRLLGVTGASLDTVVNLGIGGSHLGPAMVADALAKPEAPRVRFVSNVDGAALTRATDDLDPARTLFVVVSKSFGTAETLRNAETARAWLRARLGVDDVSAHFVVVTARPDRAADWGSRAQLRTWEWVGGRFSMWGSVGFAAAVALGVEGFRQLLAGARAADRHVRETPVDRNVPVWLALMDVWNHEVRGVHSRAVVPYDERLALLPALLQQTEMESNGKSVTLGGEPTADATGPVVWGAPGTDAQHAFFQLIHQGTQVVAVDFVVAARPDHGHEDHHRALLANCIAQSRALAWGRTVDEVSAAMRADGVSEERIAALAPHRSFPGLRPSTTFVLDRLDARTLGTLVALYEHAVAIKGFLWGVPSFDQWGVELGKVMAARVETALGESEPPDEALDATTRALIQLVRARR